MCSHLTIKTADRKTEALWSNVSEIGKGGGHPFLKISVESVQS